MAIRVPIGPQVATAPLPRPGIAPGQTGQLLQEAGAAIQGVSGQAAELFRREKQRADAARVAQLETEFQTSANRLLDDLSAKRGEEAFAAEQATLEELGKLRDGLVERAGGLDRWTRDDTLRKLGTLFEGARRDANAHITKQRRAAMVDTIQAREASALDALARNFDDPVGRSEQMGAAEEVIGALSPTEEGRAQAQAEFRKKAHVVVLERYLVTRDTEGAKAYLAKVRDELGAAASQVEKHLLAVERDTEAEREAMRISEGATDARTGWVDEARAVGAVDALTPGPIKDEVRARVERRVAASDGLRKNEVNRRFRMAYAAYIRGGYGSIPPTLKEWLTDNAPEMLDRLRDDADRKRRLSRSDRAEARRAQADANRLALYDYMARPAEERAGLDIEATYGGTGPDDIGLGALMVKQREAADAVKKGRALSEAEFVRRAKAAASGTIKTRKQMAEFEAEMRLQFGEEKEPPSPERARKIIADGLSEKTLERPWLWDTTERGFESRRRERLGGLTAEEREDAELLEPLVPAGGGAPRPTKAERIRQLSREGKSTNEIVQIMNSEGY